MPESYKIIHPKYVKHYISVGTSKNNLRKTKF